MSDQAPWNRTRLLWGHGKAIARLDGLVLALTEAPTIQGRMVEMIDFVPFTIAVIRFPKEGEREMYAAEVTEALQVLRTARDSPGPPR